MRGFRLVFAFVALALALAPGPAASVAQEARGPIYIAQVEGAGPSVTIGYLKPAAVDLVAASQDELLTLLDGRVVKLADGRSVQLATLGRVATPVAPTLWEQLRLTLADPTIAFILLVMGALAIYLELAVPGTT